MRHSTLIKRWADMPDGTMVWFKDLNKKWCLDHPAWHHKFEYVIDNKWADLAKQVIDDPELEIEVRPPEEEDWYFTREPIWAEDREYRIKPKEWYEDMPERGVVCWVHDSIEELKEATAVIVEYDENVKYRFISKEDMNWNYATPLTKEDLLEDWR